MIECRVIDLSAGGACLELGRHYDLPNTFEFIHAGSRRFCYLAWRRGNRLGVSYEAAYQKSGNKSGLSLTTTSLSRLSQKKPVHRRPPGHARVS